jgi:hypothetical protein
MRRIALALFVVATVTVAAVGCGGSEGGGGDALSKEDYGAKVASVGQSLATAFEGVAEEAGSVDASQIESVDDLSALMTTLADAVAGGIASLESAADELESVDPPGDAADAHGQLVDGLRKLAADFGELEQAIRDGEFSDIVSLGTELQNIATSEAGTLIQGAIDDLKAKGYDVDPEG